MNKKTLILIYWLAAVAVLNLCCSQRQEEPLVHPKAERQQPAYEEGKLYKVTKVYDGDTIQLEGGEKVRLIGIDAPETYPNKKSARDSMRTRIDVGTIVEKGKRSAEFARNLLNGKKVRLEYDIEIRDKYDRLLAYVFIDYPPYVEFEQREGLVYGSSGVSQYVFVNATIIKSGFASPMTIPPNVKYAKLFKKLYEEARENKRGLWINE